MNSTAKSCQRSCLFVTNSGYLGEGGGGVQWCTREYLLTIEAAGFEIFLVDYEIDRSLTARLKRKIRPRPFENLLRNDLSERILEEAARRGIEWVFLNNSEANSLAPRLRALNPDLKLIFLSHGMELTDEVNTLRLDPALLPRHRKAPEWIGRLLKREVEQRRALDGAICISKEDMLFEQWLGVRGTAFIPRTIPSDPLELKPLAGRFGTVATLNHIPNLDGIRHLAAALGESAVSLRLVGGPDSVGRGLQDEFPCITYCGPLNDADLRQEASTWSAFVNPVFCQARGASTKVATALGWGLPVLTTPQGARGYNWDTSLLPLSETPANLAEVLMRFSEVGVGSDMRQAAGGIISLAPSIEEASKLIASFLSEIGQ